MLFRSLLVHDHFEEGGLPNIGRFDRSRKALSQSPSDPSVFFEAIPVDFLLAEDEDDDVGDVGSELV